MSLAGAAQPLLAASKSHPLRQAVFSKTASAWQAFAKQALLFMGGFGHFEMNYIMTGGGPRNLTNVLAVWTYQESFQFLRFDRAAAASGVILSMTSIVAIFYLWAQTKDTRR